MRFLSVRTYPSRLSWQSLLPQQQRPSPGFGSASTDEKPKKGGGKILKIVLGAAAGAGLFLKMGSSYSGALFGAAFGAGAACLPPDFLKWLPDLEWHELGKWEKK